MIWLLKICYKFTHRYSVPIWVSITCSPVGSRILSGGGGQLLRPKVADVARQICVKSETFVVGAQDPLADFLMLKCACITESCYSDYFPPYLAKRRQIKHAVL